MAADTTTSGTNGAGQAGRPHASSRIGRRWPLFNGVRQFFHMRVVNRYLAKSVAVSFGMALLIFTFMMIMGSLVKIFELIFQKFSIIAILQFLMYVLPHVICFALPFSMAAATLLVFSRLSADGEVTAMKANGISVFQIASPCVAFSLLVALIALYAYDNILPFASFAQRNVIVSYMNVDPTALIETGSWTPIGRYKFLVDEREGNLYRNIFIIQDLGDGRSRRINAERGFCKYLRQENKLLFELYNFTSEERNADRTNTFLRSSANRVEMYVNVSQMFKQRSGEVRKRVQHYTTADLRRIIDTQTEKMSEVAAREGKSFDQLRGDVRAAERIWARLQKSPSFKKVLKDRGRSANRAFEDIIGRAMLNDYLADIRKADGKDSPAAGELSSWFKAWMRINEFYNAITYRSQFMTEVSYRRCYALASIAFAIIGIPLGIRAHRSEKTIGFLICLILIAIHYALVISVKSFSELYMFRPDILIWVPDLLFIATGLYLLWHQHKYS